MKNGKKIKAVIPGGSSVPVVPGEVMLETNMDYESISQAGSMLGSGAVIVMDEDTNMVEVIHRIARFYYSESCGQCTPCREGTGWMFKIIDKILKRKRQPRRYKNSRVNTKNDFRKHNMCFRRRSSNAG